MREISLEKFVKARQSRVEIGGRFFTISRPTSWDVAQAQASKLKPNLEWAVSFVVDWDFAEADLLPGGDPEPVEFNREVLFSWLKDRTDCWGPLVDAVVSAYKTHKEALDERGNA